MPDTVKPVPAVMVLTVGSAPTVPPTVFREIRIFDPASTSVSTTVTAEATVNGLSGTYTPGTMIASRGDVLVAAAAWHEATFAAVGLSAPSLDLTGFTPNPALSWGQVTGYKVGHGIFPLRIKRGSPTLGDLTFTLDVGDCRGPLVVARMRVR